MQTLDNMAVTDQHGNAVTTLRLERRPIDDWIVAFYPDFISVAAHMNGGGLYWTKYPFSKFPKDNVVLGDVNSFIVQVVEGDLNAGSLQA